MGGRRPGAHFKRGRRARFGARHADQVWEDARKEARGEAVGDRAAGPVGTTDRAARDEDLPGGGQFYCVPCGRYFVGAGVLAEHERTKPHKRRVKALRDERKPHGQRDAEAAAGMAPPDNGPVTRSRGAGEGSAAEGAGEMEVVVPMAAGFDI